MTYPLYARTTHDGLVLLGSYPTRPQRDRAAKDERERFATLGSGDVVEIVTEPPGARSPEPPTPQTFTQEAMNL